MPYIFVEELEEGQEEVEVYTADQYNQLQMQVDELTNSLEQTTDRAIEAEAKHKKLQKKYADAFLSKPAEEAAKMATEQIASGTYGSSYENMFKE